MLLFGANIRSLVLLLFFFFNDTATTEIYTLSLHGRSSDLAVGPQVRNDARAADVGEALREPVRHGDRQRHELVGLAAGEPEDRKSTRLNSSHANISYAVFCLKKKNQIKNQTHSTWRSANQS